jgi:hypothetical protein
VPTVLDGIISGVREDLGRRRAALPLTELEARLGAVAAALSSRSWAGLSSRYERGARPESGPRGQVRSAWDELSEGGDPTLRDSPEQT